MSCVLGYVMGAFLTNPACGTPRQHGAIPNPLPYPLQWLGRALFNAAWGPISVEAIEEGVEPLLVFYVCRMDGGKEV